MKIKAVALMREARERMAEETAGMSREEQREYLRKHSGWFRSLVHGMPNNSATSDRRLAGRPDHSCCEMRFLTFGVFRNSKFLIVSYTERQDVTRIISARKMSRQEREIYENG